MIESAVMQYGVLGLWTASLLIDKALFHRKLIKTLEDLRMAIRH